MAIIKVSKSRGYTGNRSKKSYVAVIDGLCSRYGLNRRFLETDDIDWGDSELFRKKKGTWTEIHHVGIGMYEVCEYGERRIVMVWLKGDVETKTCIAEDRAHEIAYLMDSGSTFEEARRATRAPSPKTEAVTHAQ